MKWSPVGSSRKHGKPKWVDERSQAAGASERPGFRPRKAASPATAARPERILFIGNSYTFCNALPKTLEALVDASPDLRALRPEMVAHGGWTLEQHWQDQASRALLARGGWDTVVLQEQTRRPYEGTAQFHTSVRDFDREIRAGGARTVLYLTWAPGAEPERQPQLDESLRAIGAEIGAPVVPVGPAFALVRSRAPQLALYVVEDNRHPSARGTYLAACTFFAALRQRTPQGLPAATFAEDDWERRRPSVLPPAEAEVLQRAAWDALAGWRPR